jgi:hypothetical protein
MNTFINTLRKQPRTVQKAYSVLRKGTWTNSSVVADAIGTEYVDPLRRMRELRELGVHIETRFNTNQGEYQYRIVR